MTHPDMRAHFLGFIAILVFLASPATGLAQQSQPGAVHRELTITTTDSAGRTITVEVPDTTVRYRSPAFDAVRVRENWSKLRRGFSQSDVERLLGVSPKVRYDETHEYWWYGDRAVIFNVITGKVSGWDE